MPLPKIGLPTLPILVPSLNRAARFRPFTVREEKILLMARESTDEDERLSDWLRAVHQVVGNCLLDDSVPVDDLAEFDLQWLFLKLREASVGPTVPQSFIDKEDGKPFEIVINLSEVKAPALPEGWSGQQMIELSSNDSVFLRYPPATLYTEGRFVTDPENTLLYRSTIKIMQGQTVYTDFTQEEVIEYYDGCTTDAMQKVKDFLTSVPTMEYEATYTNSLGHEKKVRLTGLNDFFNF